MNLKRTIIGSIMACLVVAALKPIYSQPGPLELIAPVDIGVSVAVYDVTHHLALSRFFESPESARLSKYSIVVTNSATKDIVGVAVRWNVTDHNGQNRTATWSVDSFSTNQAIPQPVIPTGTQLTATPNGFSRSISTVDGAGGISSFGGHGQDVAPIDDLDRAQHVTAIVDTIIFKDGRVIGADESHLVDYINAIATAVKALVQKLRDAGSNDDVDNVLRSITSMKRARSLASLRADPGSWWMMTEADLLLIFSVEQRMQRLNLLERVPLPPLFYR